jgi:hypothetical protein
MVKIAATFVNENLEYALSERDRNCAVGFEKPNESSKFGAARKKTRYATGMVKFDLIRVSLAKSCLYNPN